MRKPKKEFSKTILRAVAAATVVIVVFSFALMWSCLLYTSDNIDAATLKKGAAVAYVCFEDDTGLIFATLS